MANTSKQNPANEEVSFTRGGKTVTLLKSPNLISVCLKENYSPENLANRFAATARQSLGTLRYSRRLSGTRVGVFMCEPGKRDQIMTALREEEETVLFASHVLLRNTVASSDLSIGVDNKLYLDFDKEPKPADLREIEAKNAIRAIWRFPEAPGSVVFELTTAARDNPIKIANALQKSGKYKTAEPCLIEAKVGRAVPGDVGFERQWHLLNQGQGGGQPGADCNAVRAWDFTWGDPGVTVAIIDDGFDLAHPDFGGAGKVRDAFDATERDSDPRPSYFSEKHGTACAGVALAARGGGSAVGVAPDCTLMPIRHAGELGDFEEALAFYHAYRHRADVISCSWGPPDASSTQFWPLPSLTRQVMNICVKYGRGRKGIPIFFAAGNGNEPLDLDGYANDPLVIAVAACTNQDQKSFYSDYGRGVWVTAPSSGGTLGIFTTDRVGTQGYNQFSDYTHDFGGTSSSTPLVAGIAALMISVNPDITVDQIKKTLKETAVKINRSNPKSYTDRWNGKYSDEYDTKGHSLAYGWGRVDAGAAVEKAFKLRQNS